MRPSKPLAVLVLFLCSITYIACKKQDLTSKSNQQLTQSFNLSQDIPSAVKRVSETIVKQDGRLHFLETFLKNEGTPIWAKASLYLRNSSRKSRSNGSGIDTTVLIPVVKDRDSIVSSFLACNVSSDTVLIKFIRAGDYRKYTFENRQDSITADELAVQLMVFQKQVFGDSTFAISDSRLFNFKNKDGKTIKSTRITIGNATRYNARSTAGMLLISWEECYLVMHDGDQGQLVGVAPGGQNDYYYEEDEVCIPYSVWIDEGGGGGGGGGDYGGGDPGTGGGGGGGWYDNGTGNPCPPTTVEKGARAEPIDGCSPGWTPSPIDANGYYYSRISTLNSLLSSNKFGLLPCDMLNLIPYLGYGSMYQQVAQYQVPQPVLDRIAYVQSVAPSRLFDPGFQVQLLNDAYGNVVNCDFFPVRITKLPTINGVQATPRDLLEYFRIHINDFIQNVNVQFNPYNDGPNLFSGGNFSDDAKFNSPFEASLGVIMHIKLMATEDGSVVESDYRHIDGTGWKMDEFKYTTIHSPLDGDHPVSGNREFGIYSVDTRPGEYTFYTMGVDRATNWLADVGSSFGFSAADNLWTDIQNNLMLFINNPANGGSAEIYTGTPNVIARPDWSVVKDYLLGHISLDELKARMGC